MIDVPHDGDNRRTERELRAIDVLVVDDVAFQRAHLDVEAELIRDELRGGRIEQFVHGGHDAELEQRLDHLAGLPAHLLCQLCHGHGLRHADGLAPDFDRRGFDRERFRQDNDGSRRRHGFELDR